MKLKLLQTHACVSAAVVYSSKHEPKKRKPIACTTYHQRPDTLIIIHQNVNVCVYVYKIKGGEEEEFTETFPHCHATYVRMSSDPRDVTQTSRPHGTSVHQQRGAKGRNTSASSESPHPTKPSSSLKVAPDLFQ